MVASMESHNETRMHSTNKYVCNYDMITIPGPNKTITVLNSPTRHKLPIVDPTIPLEVLCNLSLTPNIDHEIPNMCTEYKAAQEIAWMNTVLNDTVASTVAQILLSSRIFYHFIETRNSFGICLK